MLANYSNARKALGSTDRVFARARLAINYSTPTEEDQFMSTDVRTKSRQTNRWRWVNPALRVVAAVQAVLVVLQASLAGLSLTGSREALVWHERLGTEYVTLLGMIVLVLAVLNWRPGRAAAWPALLALVALLALLLQIVTGFERTLGVHLPTGVLIFGANLVIALKARFSRTA